MKKLKLQIEQFNNALKEKSDFPDLYHLNFSEPASKKKINEIQDFFGMPIPQELQTIYTVFGSIENEIRESYALEIPSIDYLLKYLKEENKWYKCHSLGLIDYIKFSWTNDRPEFEKVEQSKIKYLNNHYKCFGIYRYNWSLEEAYYLYFDKNQKFGWVRYHQDYFADLWLEHLDNMLKKSPTNENLEDILIPVLDKLKSGILQNE